MKVPYFVISNVGRMLFFAFLMWFLTTSYHVWGPDPAMYLQTAKLILNGAKPYIDFIDINPPLIMYMSIIPVSLANMFGISEFFTLAFSTIALIVICAALLQNVIRASRLFSQKEAVFIDNSFLLVSTIIALMYCFSQREHLFFICFFPYLFLRIFRGFESPHFSKATVISIGLLCGLMSALKPHFFLIILCFELFLFCLDQKKYSFKQPECLCIVLVNVIYALHFLLLPADVRAAFFGELVPMVLKYYNSMDTTSRDMLKYLRLFVLQCVFIYGFIFILWPHLTDLFKRILKCITFVGLVALILYVLQHKGWPYQLIISFAMTFMCFAFAVLVSFKTKSLAGIKYKYCAIAILLTLISIFFPLKIALSNVLGFKGQAYIPELSLAKQYLRSSIEKLAQSGEKIVILSVNPSYSYPYFVHKGYWPGTRYLFLFPIAFFNNRFEVDDNGPYPYKSFEQMSVEEQLFLQRLQEDIRNSKPKVLAFISAPRDHTFLSEKFDIFKYFEVNGSWANWEPLYELVYSKTDILVYKRK